jgi:hypothetical protein
MGLSHFLVATQIAFDSRHANVLCAAGQADGLWRNLREALQPDNFQGAATLEDVEVSQLICGYLTSSCQSYCRACWTSI